MSIVESEFAQSRDPRLAAQLFDHATSATPAWLWSADGSRILWANAVGAAIFGAASTSACTARRFDAKQPAAWRDHPPRETLPSTGQARLERLRGFGASFGRTLTCACSRFLFGQRLNSGPGHRHRARRTIAAAQRAGQAPIFGPDPAAGGVRSRRDVTRRHFGRANASYGHANIVGAWAGRDRISSSRGWQR